MNLHRTLTFALAIALNATSFFAQNEPPGTEEQFRKQYEERIKKDRLAGVYIPKNLEDACGQLSKLTSLEAREKFQKLPEDSVAMFMHVSLGKWMIVNWGFYEGSRLSHYLRSAGVTYPDDMADFLTVAWHRQLNGKSIEIKELVLRFKEKRRKNWEKDKAEKLEEGKVIHEEKRKKDPAKSAGGN